MDSAKLRERAGVSVFLAIIGAIIGAVSASGDDVLPHAVLGAIAGALLSILDVLFASFWIVAFLGGGLLIVALGLYAIYDSPSARLFILLPSTIAAIIGGFVGRGSDQRKGDILRTSLQFASIVFGITTCLTGLAYLIAHEGGDGNSVPSPPPPPIRIPPN